MAKKESKKLYTGNQEKIKVAEEKLQVDKQRKETGKVKISKKVLKEEVPIDLSGFEEEIEIERKKINRVVKKPGPAVRREGDSTVYSLYKEVYVKQTILDEEVWISKKQVQKSFKGKQKLRKEVIDIERLTSEPSERE